MEFTLNKQGLIVGDIVYPDKSSDTRCKIIEIGRLFAKIQFIEEENNYGTETYSYDIMIDRLNFIERPTNNNNNDS